MLERVPEGHANYRGDVRGTFDENRPYGPGYDGEYRWPVETEYDPETDRTRVGFTRTPPPQPAH